MDGDFKEPKSYEGAKRILAEGECTAVIATSNKTTWGGVMRAVRDLRLSIPGDVNVIGFDSQDWTEFSDNPIATIVQPAFTMGNLAASLLLQQINGREFSSENVVLKAEIKIAILSCQSRSKGRGGWKKHTFWCHNRSLNTSRR